MAPLRVAQRCIVRDLFMGLVNRRETKDIVGSHSSNKLIYKQARKYMYICTREYVWNTLLFLLRVFRDRPANFYLWTHPKSIVSKEEWKLCPGRGNQFFSKVTEILSEFRRIYPISYLVRLLISVSSRRKLKLIVNSWISFFCIF